jgi:hypothetical protein
VPEVAVDDVDEARDELLSHGVDVSGCFTTPGGGPAGGFIGDTEARGRGPRCPIPLLRHVRERLAG